MRSDKTGGAGGVLPELIGKSGRMATPNNSADISGSSSCITPQADGSYLYAAKSGSTGPGYGTASPNRDAGT